MTIQTPRNVAEAVANAHVCYRILKERMTAGGHARKVPKYNHFQRIFFVLVAVCGEAQGYESNTSNALAVITWLIIKFDIEFAVSSQGNPEPVYEFAMNSIKILNRMAKEAKKKDKAHVIYGPVCKN